MTGSNLEMGHDKLGTLARLGSHRPRNRDTGAAFDHTPGGQTFQNIPKDSKTFQNYQHQSKLSKLSKLRNFRSPEAKAQHMHDLVETWSFFCRVARIVGINDHIDGGEWCYKSSMLSFRCLRIVPASSSQFQQVPLHSWEKGRKGVGTSD